jgi:hypothetical protein
VLDIQRVVYGFRGSLQMFFEASHLDDEEKSIVKGNWGVL